MKVQALVRFSVADAEIAGQRIPADQRILAWTASANHDERVFPDPDRFDVAREPNHHLDFGAGIHFCLGAPLARMEVRIVLELLTWLAPDLELVPDQDLTFPPNVAFRGPRRLLLQRT